MEKVAGKRVKVDKGWIERIDAIAMKMVDRNGRSRCIFPRRESDDRG